MCTLVVYASYVGGHGGMWWGCCGWLLLRLDGCGMSWLISVTTARQRRGSLFFGDLLYSVSFCAKQKRRGQYAVWPNKNR